MTALKLTKGFEAVETTYRKVALPGRTKKEKVSGVGLTLYTYNLYVN